MRVLALTIVLFLAGVMCASADCKIAKSDFDDFGLVPLGAIAPGKIDKLVRRTSDCDYRGDGHCTYLGSAGVQYYVAVGYVESKTIAVADWPKSKSLPFGLARNDTRASAKLKLLKRYSALEDFDDAETRTMHLLTATCLRNSRGEEFSITVNFGANGRLQTFSSSIPSPRD